MLKAFIGAGLAIATLLALPAAMRAQTGQTQTIETMQAAYGTRISGEIIRISGDDFILSDATGQILVEAESRPLRRANLQVGETVTVFGRLDEAEFEAFRITRENGEDIYIFDD